jgi:methylenetetrahydrofolate dehydrogenase (NADP+)/methenyltetrahydrofolate cyclohydrolase
LTTARILDGAAIAKAVRGEAAAEVARLRSAHGVTPKLSVVLAGDDPASAVYVRNKDRACREAGMASDVVRMPEATPEALLATVRRLNQDPLVHGILVQLPLPGGIDPDEILLALDPAKDVDGLHPENAGRLLAGMPGFVPCTPAGIIEILRRSSIALAGCEAVVVGRSRIVGKPVSVLLLRENATVTMCHSKTRDLAAVARRADVLVAAIGRPAFVTAGMIKPGAVVVDVGINRCTSEVDAARFWPGDAARLDEIRTKGSTLVGDVHPADAMKTASAFTPVPRGVGPMTIAMLLMNTVRAARIAAGIPVEA